MTVTVANAAVATPAFVQVNAATPQTNQSTVSVAYTSAQTAGNTNILAIGWNNATSNITSVTDSAGNIYQLAVPTARGPGLSQAIYYATNIKAAAAATNTVTVSFNASTPYVDIRALEYSGLDPVNPFNVGTSAAGTGTSANSGTVATTAANALIFGAGMTTGAFSAAGTNFVSRIFTSPDADIAEDRLVTATGSYNATAPLSGSAAWVMQVAAFMAAGSGGTDTIAPTAAITAPSAGSTVSGTVTIAATASDNVGVAGVQFLLDNTPLGAEDTTSPYSISWNTTTAANGTHTLTALARDVNGNTALSAPVTVTVANSSDTVAPTAAITAPSAGSTVSGTVTIAATASDNVGVAGVQFLLDNTPLGAEDTTSPYSISWNTTTAANGSHTLTALARDVNGNTALSAPVTVTVANAAVATPAFVQVNAATPQTNQSTVSVAYTSAQTAGNTNILAIGWNNATSNITSVTDSAGNIYQLAVPTARGPGLSQAIYYATNIKAAAAATNTVTVSFNASTPYVDIRALEYSGLDPVNPFNVGTSAAGTGTSANSGTVATTAANALIFGAGMTTGAFSAAGTNFVSRILTSPDADIAEDRLVTATGNYNATAPLSGSAAWVMQVAAFKAAGSGGTDTIAPTVQSINRVGTTPTNAASVSWTVLFSESVTAVDVGDFALVTTGTVAGATITTVSGSGNQYTVTANTGTGNGTLGLNLVDNDTIRDTSANPLGGPGVNGSLTGQIYTIDKTQPTVTIAQAAGQADPTITSPINFTATFSETVTGFAANDISFAGSTVGGTLNAVVTGTGATYNVAVSGMTTAGNVAVSVLVGAATDAAGNLSLASTSTDNTVAYNPSAGSFGNEILATGFNLPTAMKFLPDGRMLVAELGGTIKVLSPPYTQAAATPFLQLTNVGGATDGDSRQQGVYEIALDPNFSTNHYYYIFYTAGTPNRDRLSRFTANATLTGTVPGSEFIIYEDPQNAEVEHHGGAINFGNDGKIYLTTGEHFQGSPSQSLSSPRGKILRFNPDGTVPTDNPFFDGNGPNYDAIWALGLRNPYRAYYDAPTGRLLIGDVGGNDGSTAIEELNVGLRGANYGWPNVEGTSSNPAFTSPIYSYPHNGRDASITGGFVYHGTQFPSSYQGSYFFADYSQNWIKRLTFDANGNVNGVFNFEPANGAADGPTGDIVYLTEGPEGALYYVDLGFSDTTGVVGVSKIRRISFVNSNLPPVVSASATPTGGLAPLTVVFSSAGSSDPEGAPLTYSWNFGDGSALSTASNPTHTYTSNGSYQTRLTVSDGVNSTLSTPLSISVGIPPVITNLTVIVPPNPSNNGFFRAGDVISFSAQATDADGTLNATAYTWNIDFLHEGHVHPGTPVSGVTSGTFTIPTSGHDFSGNTRYRISLTVTDSNGLQTNQSTIVFPDKVNLTFDTVPAGLVLFVDGIAHTGPFVYDTLIGFNHNIEARNQTIGTNTYNFASWSDGGTQQHTILVPAAAQAYTATYNVVSTPVALAFVQVNAATPQTNQSTVSVAYTSAQTAGNTNILAIGWNNATSNITSVTDSAGNIYQLAVPTARGPGLSQAIYYATNIKAAAAATNTVTVSFNASTPYVDIRALEYSGLDPVNPFELGTSAAGTGTSANSGTVATTAANALIFGAGMTTGAFSAAGTNFVSRIFTSPDADIAEDRLVTATGSYNATAPLSGSAAWVMQVAAFKAASASTA